MQTYYPSAYVQRLVKVSCVEGSALNLSTGFKGLVGELGVDLEQATWVGDGPVTLTDDTLTGTTSSVLMTATGPGRAFLECFGFFEDGQVRKQQYEVCIAPAVN